jgi:hypothetical protein
VVIVEDGGVKVMPVDCLWPARPGMDLNYGLNKQLWKIGDEQYPPLLGVILRSTTQCVLDCVGDTSEKFPLLSCTAPTTRH